MFPLFFQKFIFENILYENKLHIKKVRNTILNFLFKSSKVQYHRKFQGKAHPSILEKKIVKIKLFTKVFPKLGTLPISSRGYYMFSLFYYWQNEHQQYFYVKMHLNYSWFCKMCSLVLSRNLCCCTKPRLNSRPTQKQQRRLPTGVW